MDLSVVKQRVDFRLPVNIIAELDSLSDFFHCDNRTDAICRVIQELFDAIFYQEVYLKSPFGTFRNIDYDQVLEAVHCASHPIALGNSCDHALPHEM